MRYKAVGLLVAVVVGLAGCATSGQPRRETATPVRVTLRVGEWRDLGRLHLGVLDVVEDSRCPQGASCITAGRVRVRFALRPVDQPEQQIVLTLAGTPADGAQAQTLVDGWRVALVAVEPLPHVAQPIAIDQYRITCLVEAVP